MRPRDLAIAVLTGLVAATFAVLYASPLLATLPWPGSATVVVFVAGVFLLVTAAVYRRRRDADAESARRSIWDAIPRWQYTGRHVESGGITRDGQERALEKIQEQAGTLDRDRSDRGE